MKRTLFAITLFIFITACATPTPDNQNSVPKPSPLADTNAPKYQWVQLGEDDAVSVRAIFEPSIQTCPDVETTDNNNGRASISMTPRAKNMPDNFDITVCEATLTNSDKLKSAILAGKNLSLPTKNPKRTVVIGDTGCRISDKTQQNCNNIEDTGDEWHFEKTVSSALNIKKDENSDPEKPDLVIHVGDYIYRESEICNQDDMKKCEGPVGSKWATWEVDFFMPAKPLLEEVPWVFARGNHENCDREWRGWYLFFDPRPLTDTSLTKCVGRSEPFNVKLDGLDLLVLDSSAEEDPSENDIKQINASAKPTWLITHVPLWAVGCYYKKQEKEFFVDKLTPDAALTKAINSKISFLVSGHLHLFEMILFDDKPSQMIAGGGATELDCKLDQTEFVDQMNKNDFKAKSESEVLVKFTFAYIDAESDKWKATIMDQDGMTEKQSYTINK